MDRRRSGDAVPPPEEAPAQHMPAASAAPRRSGRVRFDERGQAVWEWAVRTGMFDRNASTQRVRALADAALELEQEPRDATAGSRGRPASGPVAAVAAPVADRSTGFDPYERAAPIGRPRSPK